MAANVARRASYLQVADDLQRRLDSGELSPGDMLPSEHALALRYSVSRGTARAGLAVLADAGLIEVVPGQGRRVVGVTATPTAVTAWEKVAADVRSRLQADPRSVSPLPSEAEMASVHGVSRNTVRRAYRQLADEGLVIVRHGAGAFPAPRSEG